MKTIVAFCFGRFGVNDPECGRELSRKQMQAVYSDLEKLAQLPHLPGAVRRVVEVYNDTYHKKDEMALGVVHDLRYIVRDTQGPEKVVYSGTLKPLLNFPEVDSQNYTHAQVRRMRV